jgi:Kef-type K+ transport system membrane component KefB
VTTHQLTYLLIGLAVIVVLAQLMGGLARRCGQPAVIGEILAGILIGPTVLHGVIADSMLVSDVRPLLGALANVGIAAFMFIVGYEIDRGVLRGRSRAAISISLSSTVVPLCLGVLLANHLLRTRPVDNRLGFVLFFGVAMSISAFPVLARILIDRNLHRTPVGGLALTAAAVNDVLAWLLLAMTVALVRIDSDQWQLLLLLPYLLLMLYPVRWGLRRLLAGRMGSGRLSAGTLAVVLAGLLVSGGMTEWFGLHVIFGAFLFGIVMPRDDGRLRAAILEQVEPVTRVLLLPVFFIMAGINVDLSGFTAVDAGDLLLILAAAVVGKVGGAFLAARVAGLDARESTVLGVLMNTRGLTELIVLEIGRQLGLLDTGLYSLLVVMAVVTTGMTGPLLHLCYRSSSVADRRRTRIAAGRPWWAGG